MTTAQHHLVSVVIPTYNRAWALARALDSVLAQDYTTREIIVVDDGSTDRTRELLTSYQGKIQVLTQANKGVSAARNRGIRHSRGRFVALLDSDDAWEKKKISCQVNFFDQTPGAWICQTQEIWIRRGRRVNPKKKHAKPSGMIFEPSLHLCLVSPSAVMMKKELFDRVGLFNEDFPVCEDYDLWLRIACQYPVFLIDRPLTVKFGGHPDQLSSAHSQDRYRIASLEALIRSGRLSADQATRACEVLKEKCLIYGNGCIKRGRTAQGHQYLDRAGRAARLDSLMDRR